jgi:hypothetical protein
MLGKLQLINVVLDGETFSALYRVTDGVLTLNFAGSEIIARPKGVNPEAVAERLLRSLLVERAALRLREVGSKPKRKL